MIAYQGIISPCVPFCKLFRRRIDADYAGFFQGGSFSQPQHGIIQKPFLFGNAGVVIIADHVFCLFPVGSVLFFRCFSSRIFSLPGSLLRSRQGQVSDSGSRIADRLKRVPDGGAGRSGRKSKRISDGIQSRTQDGIQDRISPKRA